jgi:hypothetical protein
LSRHYPGARAIHVWNGGHAHSAEFASVDPPETVRAYYRRYAAQNPGYKVSERDAILELDGGGAMGMLSVSAAPESPPDPRLHKDERTLISSSRP